jgi:hypothetical protein
VSHHRLQTSVWVFWVKQLATHPSLTQSFDYFNSDTPPVELQFLIRPNLNALIGWRAHNAGWHVVSVTAGRFNSKSWLLFMTYGSTICVGLTQRCSWLASGTETSQRATGGQEMIPQKFHETAGVL